MLESNFGYWMWWVSPMRCRPYSNIPNLNWSAEWRNVDTINMIIDIRWRFCSLYAFGWHSNALNGGIKALITNLTIHRYTNNGVFSYWMVYYCLTLAHCPHYWWMRQSNVMSTWLFSVSLHILLHNSPNKNQITFLRIQLLQLQIWQTANVGIYINSLAWDGWRCIHTVAAAAFADNGTGCTSRIKWNRIN